MRKAVSIKNVVIGISFGMAAMLIAAACGNTEDASTGKNDKSRPAINAYQSNISSSDTSSAEASISAKESPDETSCQSSSIPDETTNTRKPEGDVQLDDILIIVRENGHGWNDSDKGKFITSDGWFFEFDATELEPENKSARFIEYENLYPILLEIAKTENPLAQVNADELSKNILDFKADLNDRTSESVGFDIGKVDYQIVREVNGELVFESIYSHGDSICGYTKNETAMKIVDITNQIIRDSTPVYGSGEAEQPDSSEAEELTDKDIADMEEVDKVISSLVESEDFKNGTLEEKEKLSFEVLDELIEKGFIKKDTVVKSDDLICFEYSCGAGGGIKLKEFDPLMN